MKLLLLPGSHSALRLLLRMAFLVFCFVLNGTCKEILAQTQETVHNRLRYHKYSWQALHANVYHVYFPSGYDSLSHYALRELPAAMSLARQRMGVEPEGEINLIVYPSAEQLFESNAGSHLLEQHTLPTVLLQGTRILLGFNGSYADFRAQIQEAICRMVWVKAIKPGLQGPLANDELPDWLREGMLRYFSNGWPVEDEQRLLLYLGHNLSAGWKEMAGANPELAGSALAYYLDHRYYTKASLQFFHQLRAKHDLDRALRMITKSTTDSVLADCVNWFRKRGEVQKPHENLPIVSIRFPHPPGIVGQVLLSPNGRHCAYVLHETDKRKVYLYDLQSGRSQRISTYYLPPWISNHHRNTYPALSWQPDGALLLVTGPKKGRVGITAFDNNGRRIDQHTLHGVDGITNMQAISTQAILLSAFRNGQSDVVLYDPEKERFRPLTNDASDNLRAAADRETGRVVFLSEEGRVDAVQPAAQGIFEVGKQQPIPIVTDTSVHNKLDRPVVTSQGVLATNTATGRVRFIWIPSHGAWKPLGNYRPFTVSLQTNTISFPHAENDSICITQYSLDDWLAETSAEARDSTGPWLKDFRKDALQREAEERLLKDSDKKEKSYLGKLLLYATNKPKAEPDTKLQATPYILQLHSAYFTLRINNDYFINRYQPFLNYQGQYRFPQPGGMAAGGLSDLFENHHFSLAYRMPVGTEGSDFFIRYANDVGRTSWSALWFRKVEALKPDPYAGWKDEQDRPYPGVAKVRTNYYELSLSRPFDYFTALRFTTAIRQDRTVFSATEKYSLHFDDISSTWSVSTLAASSSRLRAGGPFLYKGYKATISFDLFKGFSQNKDALYAAAVDLQYHQPLYRQITAVGRLKAGHSGGSSRLLTNMGGVDNNLTVRTDTTVHFSQQAPYAFQTLVTPLRGYFQNSIYGNQYLLFNADLYFPLFNNLFPLNTPLRSVNNLQPGIFADFAWARESWAAQPASKSVWSLGFSVRTSISGYPLRFDMGWPGGGGRPVWYFSLSLK